MAAAQLIWKVRLMMVSRPTQPSIPPKKMSKK